MYVQLKVNIVSSLTRTCKHVFSGVPDDVLTGISPSSPAGINGGDFLSTMPRANYLLH